MSSLSDWYNAPKSDRGANQTVSKPSSSSGGSSSNKKTPVPTPQSGGYMNTPIAGGSTPPMPSSYQSGDVTYTPGPTNWDSMSQSQRDAYGSSLAGRNVSTPKPSSGRGPGGVIGAGGGWMDGQYYPPMPQQNNQNYKVTAGMGMGGTPPPMPAMGGTTPFPVKTPEAIAAEAKARTDALLAKQTTIAGQTKQGFNTAYDRLKATTRDDRTLADAAFQRNTNPFSGSTGNQRDMTGRQRTIEDSNAQQDLQTRLANVDLSLADYANATEAERMKMETDMTNQERAYGLQADQLALQRRGQEQSQFNADRQYGLSQSDLALRQQGQSFNQGLSQAQLGLQQQNQNYNQSANDRNFNYGAGQDQLKNNAQYGGVYNPSGLSLADVNQRMAQNSSAWTNASPAEQQRLHDENLYLASLKGSTYDQSTGEYSQGNNYVGTKTPAQQQQEFNQNLAVNELKFKQDSYKQTFDENVRQFDTSTAIERAYKAGQLTLEQARTAISQQQANTASSRNNWDMSPSNPDNLLKKLQVDQFGRPKAITPEDVISQLNKSTFVELDENTKRPIVYDSQGLAKSILSLNMATKDTDYLFSYYNIDKNKLLQQLSGN